MPSELVRVRTTITNQDGVVVLDGDAHVYREPLGVPSTVDGNTG